MNLWEIAAILSIVFYAVALLWAGTGVRYCSRASRRLALPGIAGPSVSLVTAIRNEERNLSEFLQCLKNQNLSRDRFETVLVNDRSDDGSERIIAEWADQFDFKVVEVQSVPSRYNPKKFALLNGIKNAGHEVILLTDADCRPGPGWAFGMASCFGPEIIAVVGFSPVMSRTKWLSPLLLIDSLAVAVHMMAGVGWNRPYMVTGRNLAYRRSSFWKVGGYESHLKVTSGDDDLLIQQLTATPSSRIGFALSPETHVVSLGPESLAAWLCQKRRHFAAGKKYPPTVQLGYALFHLSNLVLWLAPIFLGRMGILVLAGKVLGDYFVLRQTSRELSGRGAQDFQPAFVLRRGKSALQFSNLAFLGWEALHLIFHTLVAPSSWSGRIRWKE